MEKEKIVEGNKLIVEFMGLNFIKPENITSNTSANEYVLYPRYHAEWNWLIPVVEKIGSIPYCHNVNINSFAGCCIYDDNYKHAAQGKIYIGGINGTLIESTFSAVIQFIKWYNNQKK